MTRCGRHLEATAARLPDAIACIHGGQAMRSRNFNGAADLAAHHLIKAGVRPAISWACGCRVGSELLILQLAIAKPGQLASCDADIPFHRVRVCLDDAQAVGLVTCDAFLARLQVHAGTGVDGRAIAAPATSPCSACGRAPLSIRPMSSTPRVPPASPKASPSTRAASATSCAARRGAWRDCARPRLPRLLGGV